MVLSELHLKQFPTSACNFLFISEAEQLFQVGHFCQRMKVDIKMLIA